MISVVRSLARVVVMGLGCVVVMVLVSSAWKALVVVMVMDLLIVGVMLIGMMIGWFPWKGVRGIVRSIFLAVSSFLLPLGFP